MLPNWCTCLQPWTVFVLCTVTRSVWAAYRRRYRSGRRLTFKQKIMDLYLEECLLCRASFDYDQRNVFEPLDPRTPRGHSLHHAAGFSSSVQYGNKHVVFIRLFSIFSIIISQRKFSSVTRRPSKPWPLTSSHAFRYDRIERSVSFI